MADQAFAKGGEVQHKSGGPRMVVAGFDLYGMGVTEKSFKCRWFGDNNQLQEAYFAPEELKAAPAGRSTPKMRFVTTRKGF